MGTMAIEVFNRFEKKFLLDPDTAHEIQSELLPRMDADAHNVSQPFYTISNLYYDTDDNSLIRTSLSKPVYKEKLRLRGYGVPTAESKVYLEIKKKYAGRVNKRRTTLKLHEAYEFVATGRQPSLRPYMNHQVIDEIDFFLRTNAVRPKLYLAYDRRAFTGREDPGLRITFDADIRTRRHDLGLELGDYGEALLDDEQVLMEVKTPGNLPLWLAEMLSEMGVFRTSFSKYGREYQSLLERNHEHALEVVDA
jgi:VTC domain-containing protein